MRASFGPSRTAYLYGRRHSFYLYLQGTFGLHGLFPAGKPDPLCPAFQQQILSKHLADLMITEPIDEAWTEEIRSLQGMIPTLLEKWLPNEKTYEPISFDRIYQFIFYRQLDKVEAYGLDAVRAYARRSTDFIFMETALHGNLEEALRRWSEQIEYDTDNVDWLLERL